VIRFLADEDFNNDILRGVLRRTSGLDVARVQDIGLRGADDDAVLSSAAADGRVLLTHDVSTLIGRAFARVSAGAGMPGVVVVAQSLSVGAAIADLVLIVECSSAEEWKNQVRYLPLR
jgi:predicted nuclease of predicted toxin-antitoxin system